jgi:hypothetical protein
MITGAHVLLYSENPEVDRAFFRDVLEFRSVDVGAGWLIFELPPAEAALHPFRWRRRAGSWRASSPGRGALPDVRRLEVVNAIAGGQERHMLADRTGAVGNQNDNPFAERRRDRTLPANTSDGP